MDIFNHNSLDKHEQIIFCNDYATGLKAIIAIHNTSLGPALGGCRMYPYASEADALNDALRLSRGMTYKSAMANVNYGGGKSVIIGDPKKIASEILFRAFGRFVETLNGRYITAEDVGTNVDHMAWILLETPHVVGLPTYCGGLGDPSPVTAHGVYSGIKAAVKQRLGGRDNLSGLKVAVQGLGHVGYNLCKELYAAGAQLFVTDINEEALKRVATEFNATVVKPNDIYGLNVDVFSPCALGAVINDLTLPLFKCSIIAGAANNQLQHELNHGTILKDKNILYAPDYVINAGGLINVVAEHRKVKQDYALAQSERIYDTLLKVFKTAEEEDITTVMASNKMAEQRIAAMAKLNNVYVGKKD
jgi:leucine dehydrogenase